ncbi:MAG TPA: hypothetical protein VD866_32660, partial [Urbifossiella sp.]|nr:hypothetical protein [Urbifossiella sp.]
MSPPTTTRRCRPQADRDAARVRIRRERVVPLAALAGQPLDLEGRTCYPTLPVLTRWGVEGRRGVFLDLTRFDRVTDLVTSREAVARFVAECDAVFWADYL